MRHVLEVYFSQRIMELAQKGVKTGLDKVLVPFRNPTSRKCGEKWGTRGLQRPSRSLEFATRASEGQVPCFCFLLGEACTSERCRQIAPCTDLLSVWDQTGHGGAVFEQNECDVLIVCTIPQSAKLRAASVTVIVVFLESD